MATFTSLERIKILSVLFISLSQLVFGIPAGLQKRATCNADNCLRELQHSSVVASPFCSSYLGASTITWVTKLFIDTEHDEGWEQKRLSTTVTVTVTTTTSNFLDTSITQFGKRATTTSFFPSSCTEASTAISSGCSCLLVRRNFIALHRQKLVYDAGISWQSLALDLFHCNSHSYSYSYSHSRHYPPSTMQCYQQLRTCLVRLVDPRRRGRV
jgi:hypothetical protein